MRLVEVKTDSDIKKFHRVPHIIYKNDKNWICPLESMVERAFDPVKNIFFQHGAATRWILLDDNENLIGRVGAFINEKKAYSYQFPVGGMGFFECINDEKAAFMLFDVCKEWLKARGMEGMDGPINFGENDNFWGLLVEGFTPPGFGMNYNPEYYKKFFADYGFVEYYRQSSRDLDIRKSLPERFWKVADWVMRKPEFTFDHLRINDPDKYIAAVKHVYDEAWQLHENFTPINEKDLKESFLKAKAFIEEEFVMFAYHNGEPIGFYIIFPDANQLFKHMHGKENLWGKLKFLYYKKRRTVSRMRMVIMGISPRFQRYGIEAALFKHLDETCKRFPQYKIMELSWVGDFNPKMQALHANTGAPISKVHVTYRMSFDPNVEVERSTFISKERAGTEAAEAEKEEQEKKMKGELKE